MFGGQMPSKGNEERRRRRQVRERWSWRQGPPGTSSRDNALWSRPRSGVPTPGYAQYMTANDVSAASSTVPHEHAATKHPIACVRLLRRSYAEATALTTSAGTGAV